jgi:hypothetical protein
MNKSVIAVSCGHACLDYKQFTKVFLEWSYLFTSPPPTYAWMHSFCTSSTAFVTQANLQKGPPASQMLGLQACTTIPGLGIWFGAYSHLELLFGELITKSLPNFLIGLLIFIVFFSSFSILQPKFFIGYGLEILYLSF